MAERKENSSEVHRLRLVTRESRLRVIESKLAVVHTLCVAVESCHQLGDTVQASNLIEEAGRAVDTARVSIAEYREDRSAALEVQLARLEERIKEQKKRLG